MDYSFFRYYFQVRKTIPGVTYTFTIINFLKKDSLYNHGMKPLFYSEKTAERQQLGWTRRGHHIKYFQNYIKGHPLLSRDKIYYSLTFQMVRYRPSWRDLHCCTITGWIWWELTEQSDMIHYSSFSGISSCEWRVLSRALLSLHVHRPWERSSNHH